MDEYMNNMGEELNPNIEVDEYGAMYNNASHVLLKMLNPDIKEYWIREGTVGVNYGAIYNLTRLETIVFPESITEYPLDLFSDCMNLKKVVFKNGHDLPKNRIIDLQTEILRSRKSVNPDDYPYFFIPFIEDTSMSKNWLIIYDKDLLDKGIIAPAMPGLTFRQLRDIVNSMTDEELDTPIRITDKKYNMLTGILECVLPDKPSSVENALISNFRQRLKESAKKRQYGEKYKNWPDKPDNVFNKQARLIFKEYM